MRKRENNIIEREREEKVIRDREEVIIRGREKATERRKRMRGRIWSDRVERHK